METFFELRTEDDDPERLDVSNATEAKAVAKQVRKLNDVKVELFRVTEIDIDAPPTRRPRSNTTTD